MIWAGISSGTGPIFRMNSLENPGLIQHATMWHALAMSKFGKTPSGKNKYRVVHASSRRHLVYPLMGDGQAKWLRKYANEARRDNWILEGWRSIADYCSGQTVATYAKTSGICLDQDGEYDLCFEFQNGVPQDGGMTKLIQWIETRANPYQNALAIRAEWEQQEKSKDAHMEGRIREALPVFGNAPVSGFGGGSGTKTENRFKRTASQTPFKMPRVKRAPGFEKEAILFQGTFKPTELVAAG